MPSLVDSISVPATPTLGRRSREDQEFKVVLSDMTRLRNIMLCHINKQVSKRQGTKEMAQWLGALL